MKNMDKRIVVLESPVNYQPDPTLLFNHLCHNKPATLLLESSEVETKGNLKSLLVASSSIRICAYGKKVIIEPLTENGKSLMSLAEELLPNFNASFFYEGANLVVEFKSNSEFLDEDNYLKANSSLDVLRLFTLIAKEYSSSPDLVLLTGFFSYNMGLSFAGIDSSSSSYKLIPDYCFYLAEQYLVINHQNQAAQLKSFIFNNTQELVESISKNHTKIIEACKMYLPPLANTKSCSFKEFLSVADDDYVDMIKDLQSYLKSGDLFHISPARRYSLPCEKPLLAYQNLKIIDPGTYMYFMQDELGVVFGTSPESYLKYDASTKKVTSCILTGTQRRGFSSDGSIDADLDNRVELALRTDEKQIAMHIMLVDSSRNDLARVCVPKSRASESLMNIEKYSLTLHLISKVSGVLANNFDALHVYKSFMSASPLSGIPKIQAFKILQEHEKGHRGCYGGTIGYINGLGDFDACLVSKSAYVSKGVADIWFGSEISLGSDLEKEVSLGKAKAKVIIDSIFSSHQLKE